MSFDVPKVVRSPGYDHGHDEESRNGRDMKIDILEAYVCVGERSNFKIFLRTRKIMVMHSNERGECCLRTYADRLRKRCRNIEEVVVHLPDPTDPSTVTPAPPSS